MSRLVFNAILGGTTTLESTNSADTFLITVPAENGTLSLKDSSGDATFRNITLTGAVLAGAWNGSTITVPYGGTGATTLTGYVKGNGTSAMTASATIPVSDLTGTLGVANGGTGATALTGYVKGNGTSTMTASSTIPNTDITGLGTMSTQNANAVAITGGTISGLSAALPVASGGSGATTLTGYVKGNGTSAMTASSTIPNTDITGLGTMSTQGADSVAITGGTANGLTIGAINPAAGVFTTLRFNSTLSANGSTGVAGQVLTSNGASAPTWQSVGGVGTVTSVDGSGGTTGLTLTGGPITASGTLTLGGTLGVANGGTNITSYAVGDILYASASGVLSKLAAGTNGQVLTLAAGVPSWAAGAAGTVTSVSGTGTVNGLTLTGTVTSSGSLTLGGTLDLSAPPAIGGATPNTGAFTTLTTSSNAIISDNSANAALRITQVGAGNALLVEDSANPDATPTVIDSNGTIIVGNTSSVSTGGASYSIQSHNSNPFAGVRWNAAATGPTLLIGKSRSATVGTLAIVQSGDSLGNVVFSGDDGSAFVQGASIAAAVDGTPGTNDMPGRLVFSTTADGASSPTERMRIGNSGTVGIGTSNIAAATVSVGKTLTGATTTYGVLQSGQVQSDVTTVNYGFLGQLNTQATAFTLANQRHFAATQGTIGAGSSVTTQAGFFAASSLTGATNNYGFYGDIASGTGRWNFYAAGTADNYFAGNVGLGTTTPGAKLAVVGTGYSPNITLSDAATIAWDTSTGQVATFTFVSSNRTMGAPTNLVNGAFYALAVIQNGGSNTLTWNSVFKWAAGTAPTLSTAAGAKDYFVFRSDGTNLYQQGISQAVA